MRARDNPFASARLERLRFRFGDGTFAEFCERLAAQQGRGALVGPKGSGKTTLLEELRRHLQREGFRTHLIRLTEELSDLAEVCREALPLWPGQDDFLLIDGAEQLSWWHWQRLRLRMQRAGGLVITTHRPGRLPTLIECRTSPELLAQLVQELLLEERCPTRNQIQSLHQRHAGNLRESLRELYDGWAGREPRAIIRN